MRARQRAVVALGAALGAIGFVALVALSPGSASAVPRLAPGDVELPVAPQYAAQPAQVAASQPALRDPCETGDCTPAKPAACNTLIAGWRNIDAQQWTTYTNCPASSSPVWASLPFSEALYSVAITQAGLDVGVAVPMVQRGMDVFAALLDTCDNAMCLAGSNNYYIGESPFIEQHAVLLDADPKTYTLVMDSPNLAGHGDAIVSCGRHASGWCEAAAVETLSCGSYTISDTTSNGQDDIIAYYPWAYNLAYDGPEITYKLVLTEGRYLSPTLHYSGNLAANYYNYLSLFVLGGACEQRSTLLFAGLVGDGTDGASSDHLWLPAGTYYLVVDGIHMPHGGDAFRLDMVCQAADIAKQAADLNGAPLFAGDTVAFTVTFRNTSGLTLTALSLQDAIPAGAAYVAGSAVADPPAAVSPGNPLAATWASVGPGRQVTLTFRAMIDAVAGTTLTNTAGASASGMTRPWSPLAPGALGQAQAVLGPVRDPLRLAKRVAGGVLSAAPGVVSETVRPGGVLTYTLAVTNPDAEAVSGFVLTDTLPAYVTYTAGSANVPPSQAAGGRLVWVNQSIAGGAVASYAFRVTVGAMPVTRTLTNAAALFQPGRGPVSAELTGPWLDTDGDGIPDILEGDADADGDGVPNYLDLDSDGDGVPDALEGVIDSDGDGSPDFLDVDSDGDGILDWREAGCAAQPAGGATCPDPGRDTDGDGLPDRLDVDSDGDGILDWREAGCSAQPVNNSACPEPDRDTDGDGRPDYRDIDSDGDGIRDWLEAGCAAQPAGNAACPDPDRDTDADGRPDYRDIDSDGDGIRDWLEAGCAAQPANNAACPEPDRDTDNDGWPDYRDVDSDGDGIFDWREAGCAAQPLDNAACPEPNRDTDSDGTPDYRDLDSDGDGIPDAGEWSTGPADKLAGCTADLPVCTNNDADGDGMPNYRDLDTDGDRLLDASEGIIDTNGNGVSDFLDPLRYVWVPIAGR
jgi:uncharacterized repeat protein (TIGR01451 family)